MPVWVVDEKWDYKLESSGIINYKLVISGGLQQTHKKAVIFLETSHEKTTLVIIIITLESLKSRDYGQGGQLERKC